ncbi:unnamed protein product [Paramecium octaurelia]|uniref:alpha-amylase n=1 Tax=Paramecium octaurelia TaxID=43137 RepID=A0A8S1XWR8_PAROT|nr:unnamed protein product [Paramecium octaurelia]
MMMISLYYCRTKEEWKNRTIYQLLTDRYASTKSNSTSCNLGNYCGGNFKGIEKNLDYIKNLGFDAIWISPIVQNYDGAYHGYAAKNIYQINEHFGTAQDLKDLVNACHQKDIWVMIDIVANHMGNQDLDFSRNYPFNQSSHFHDLCEISDSDFATHNLVNIERCRLFMLADLNQDNTYVANELINWIKWVVSEFNIDGIRIDTAMMVKGEFWKKFTEATGIYSIGEVFDGDMGFLKQFIGPMDGLLNYPLFFTLRDVFLHWGDMYRIESFYYNQLQTYGKNNIPYMAQFNDNHDNARFLSDEVNGVQASALKILQFKAFTAFTLTSIGVPIMYYGSEQLFTGGGDPKNREIMWNSFNENSDTYKFIKKINQARKAVNAGAQDQVQRYADNDFYAFTRGQLFAAFTSKYDRDVIRKITYHPYAEGTKLCNVLFTGDCVLVQNGSFQVYLRNGEVKIFLPDNIVVEME